MKKSPIIFIAMLIALAFTSCQMNNDDSVVIPPTYKITVTATNGTVTLSKNEAKAGEKVFVESISPNEGYTTNGLEQTFQSKDGKTLTLDFGTEDGKRYFVMPECNVVITVTFKAATPTSTTEETYTITVNATNGSAKVTNASGEVITSAKAGETVTLTITPNSGYVLDSLSVKMLNAEITATISDDKTSATFTMPEKDVAINVTFKAATVTPTDDTGDGEEVEDPVDDTPTPTDTTTTDTDDNNASSTPDPTYGFVSSVDYEIYAPDGTTKIMSKKGSELNEAAKELGLVKDTDYSINETTGIITLTASGYEKVKSYIDNGNLPATPTTDGEDDGVVYAACRISLPTVEHGTIEITNKGKDGNSVVEKVYKDNTGVYLGADEGDTIELTLCPDVIVGWIFYKYFEYKNELTVKDAHEEKLTLTKVGTYTYTFTMPKTYVKVELPYGFEEPYPLTLDKPTNTTAKIFDPIGATVGKRNPGDKVYVMVVGKEVPRIEGLKRNGTYKDDDITFKDITEEVLATRYVYESNGSTRVKIDGKSYTVANGSWDLAGAHFYSFIMPRDSITIKLTGN